MALTLRSKTLSHPDSGYSASGAAHSAAGVVDEHVELRLAGFQRIDQLAAIVRRRDVRRYRLNGSERTQLLDRFIARRDVTRRDVYACPALHESLGDGKPDAATAAGDEHASCQPPRTGPAGNPSGSPFGRRTRNRSLRGEGLEIRFGADLAQHFPRMLADMRRPLRANRPLAVELPRRLHERLSLVRMGQQLQPLRLRMLGDFAYGQGRRERNVGLLETTFPLATRIALRTRFRGFPSAARSCSGCTRSE